MTNAVIVDAVRTPIGRAGDKGVFRQVRADMMMADLVRALVARAGVPAAEVEDVIIGCATQTGETGLNLGRNVVILAGLPVEVAGQSINRLCASSLQAVMSGAQAIMTGCGEVMLAGGVESMTHFPMGKDADLGALFGKVDPRAFIMGQTAEAVAQKYGVPREEQDAYALESHRKAVAAQAAGRFKDEIIPRQGVDLEGNTIEVTQDQGPRPDTSLEKLATLQPSFVPTGGTVTPGNASALNDGAAAVMLTSAEKAAALGLKPFARVHAMAVTGVDPLYMGIGPIPATRKVLARAGLTVADLDLVELNEAFAVQALVCIRELGLDPAKVNVNGGAVALGHPLGCSGARITTTLVHEMRRRGARWGLATMCVGLGQGAAIIFEGLQ